MSGKDRAETILHDESEKILLRWWKELRDGCNGEQRGYVVGAIDILKELGILNDVERDGWIARTRTCPGHDDEGGRSWCAYCGNIKEACL